MRTNHRLSPILPTVMLGVVALATGCSFSPEFKEGTIVCTGTGANECPPGFGCMKGLCRTRPADADGPGDTPSQSPVDAMPVDQSASEAVVWVDGVTVLDGMVVLDGVVEIDAREDAVDGPAAPLDAGQDTEDAAADTRDDLRTMLDVTPGFEASPPRDVASDIGDGIDVGDEADVPACSVCGAGQQRCVPEGVQTCIAVSGCATWGVAVPCDGRKVCQVTGGKAACTCPAAPVGCEGGSGTVCSGNVLRTCKVGSVDGCIFEDSTQQCTVGRPCQGAFPAAACTCPPPPAECNGTPGTLCSSDTTLTTCAFNPEGCLAVTQQTPCPAGKPCTGTFPSANCSCPPSPAECGGSPGKVCQTSSNIEACGVDSSGCLVATSVTSCPAGTTCQGDAPNAACLCPPTPPECSQGVGDSCDASGRLATCARDANNCLVVSKRTTCLGVTTCQGTTPSASCRCPAPPSYCPAAGTVCVDGSTLGTCTADAQGCLSGTTYSCSADGLSCQASSSGASCVCPAPPSACSGGAGTYCASDTTLVTCTTDSAGCIEGSSVSCPSGQYCVGSAAGGVCEAPVSLGSFVDSGSQLTKSPDYLFGESLNITKTYVLRGFGVIARAAGQAQLALYASDGTGAPGALVANTAAVTLAAGRNEFAQASPTSVVTLNPGTYWLMGIYAASTSIGAEGNTSVVRRYVRLTFGSPLPDPFPTPSSTSTSSRSNYYLLATPK